MSAMEMPQYTPGVAQSFPGSVSFWCWTDKYIYCIAYEVSKLITRLFRAFCLSGGGSSWDLNLVMTICHLYLVCPELIYKQNASVKINL